MSDHPTRHLPQQLPTATSGPFWANTDAAQDASSDDASLRINDPWPQHPLGYNDDYVFADHSDFFTEGALYSGDGSSSPNHSFELGTMSNALGLDPATASSRVLFQQSGAMSPAHPVRLPQLPSILTTDLRSPHYTHSPLMPSPSEYHAGPYSCSPGSMPVTPASLPSGSTLAPPFIQTPSLLSPGSPYALIPYGSPALSKSPYLSSGPGSPSARSYSSYSPTEESPTHHVPRAQSAVHSTVAELAAPFPGVAANLIPQRVYRPHTQSDRRRYVEEVDLEPPIMFYLTHPDGLGISCRDALNCKFARLAGRDDQMFIQRGPSVSIRLMWPGYAPWSRQIPTRDFRSPPGPITRSKLAKNVAKTVQRFLEEMRSKPMEEDADLQWRVGHRITIDDLELVGLQHVSMGSWQAHLRIRSRS